VHVFFPEDEKYPGKAYEQAAQVTRLLLAERLADGMDINDPELYKEYYKRLYDLARPQEGGVAEDLRKAITELQDFEKVASLYRVIKQDTINVLVPYQEAIGEFKALAGEVRGTGLTGDWIRRARRLTVALYRPKEGTAVIERLEHIPIGRNAQADDWFIYAYPEDYDKDAGLIPPDGQALWIG